MIQQLKHINVVTGSKVTGNGSTEITINPGTDFEDNTRVLFSK